MNTFENSVLKSPADVQSLLMDVLVKRTDPRTAMARISNYANEHTPTNGEITISRFTPLTEYIGVDGTVYYNRSELIKKLGYNNKARIQSRCLSKNVPGNITVKDKDFYAYEYNDDVYDDTELITVLDGVSELYRVAKRGYTELELYIRTAIEEIEIVYNSNGLDPTTAIRSIVSAAGHGLASFPVFDVFMTPDTGMRETDLLLAYEFGVCVIDDPATVHAHAIVEKLTRGRSQLTHEAREFIQSLCLNREHRVTEPAVPDFIQTILSLTLEGVLQKSTAKTETDNRLADKLAYVRYNSIMNPDLVASDRIQDDAEFIRFFEENYTETNFHEHLAAYTGLDTKAFSPMCELVHDLRIPSFTFMIFQNRLEELAAELCLMYPVHGAFGIMSLIREFSFYDVGEFDVIAEYGLVPRNRLHLEPEWTDVMDVYESIVSNTVYHYRCRSVKITQEDSTDYYSDTTVVFHPRSLIQSRDLGCVSITVTESMDVQSIDSNCPVYEECLYTMDCISNAIGTSEFDKTVRSCIALMEPTSKLSELFRAFCVMSEYDLINKDIERVLERVFNDAARILKS
jgi:hypothetical protein